MRKAKDLESVNTHIGVSIKVKIVITEAQAARTDDGKNPKYWKPELGQPHLRGHREEG